MKEPHNKEIQSYTIGQLAKLAGVSARTLRHYEDEGLIHPLRTSTNYRTTRKTQNALRKSSL